MKPRMLIVDDDREMREALANLFSADGHVCELASNALAALNLVEKQTFDVVVCDVLMQDMTGLELLDRLRLSHPSLPFIVITAAGGVHQAVDAIKRGAFEYMVKPCEADELRRVVTDALKEAHFQADTLRAPAPPAAAVPKNMIGDGPSMRQLWSTIDLVARSSAPVLVVGETGTGKELVARAIHSRSARRDRPFVAVNTAAIPPALLEGEIFGHVRGGFTGAVQARRGLLTEAHGGTLLLDEIGDMSFDLQAKLLRVLQFGDVRPVGSDRTHHVDVRVIASTHRDLPALIKQGLFREDLYFRLNVLPVLVPALRDRREDIPALAAYFLAEAGRRAPESPVRSIGQDALDAMMRSSWPGNVRELASWVERAVVFGVDAEIPVEQRELTTAHAPHAWPFGSDGPWTLRQMSRAYTNWVLAETSGNKAKAAQVLGIDLSTLYRWRNQND